jgi:hypothetical protein
MTLDPKIVAAHTQLDDYSCIPMSVEYVLKLAGKVPPDYFDLQQAWHNKTTGSFADFDKREIAGVRFHLQFSLARDGSFPVDDLFRTIETELAADRYVIISLAVQGGWHMFVIHEKLPDGEFDAVTKLKGGQNIITKQVRAIVRKMRGTDILTYEFV